MSVNTELDDLALQAAIRERLRIEYLRGMADGLRVAESIRGYLTRQPDKKWQQQARAWADAEIAKAKAT